MSIERPLHGGCSCGRNKYVIVAPPDATESAQVFFENSHDHRRSTASPISAYLRIPLSWYHSSTHAFFDDETHSSIHRVYTSPEMESRRHFCGFCGTPISYWSESPPEEAEWISLSVGSLTGTDLRDLGNLGLLPTEEESESDSAGEAAAKEKAEQEKSREQSAVVGVPWFESMLRGSGLGRVKRTRGVQSSSDGRTRVEWEITEWIEGDGNEGIEIVTQNSGKRKLGVVEGDDSVMDGLH